MSPWLTLAGLLFSWFQSQQQAKQQKEAFGLLRQGVPKEELAEWRRVGEAKMQTDLGRRGMLDSGLLPGARAALERNLRLAEVSAQSPMVQSLAQMLFSKSQQPGLLSSLVPLMMQYGLKGFGGEWWLKPWQQPATVTT